MATSSGTFQSFAYISGSGYSETYYDFAIAHSSTELCCVDLTSTYSADYYSGTDAADSSTQLSAYFLTTRKGSSSFTLSAQLGYGIFDSWPITVQLGKPFWHLTPVHAEFFSGTGAEYISATVWLANSDQDFFQLTAFLRLQCYGYSILTNNFQDIARTMIDLQATLWKPETATIPVHAYFPVVNDWDGEVVPSTFYPIGNTHQTFTGRFGMPEWMDMTKNPYSAGQRTYGGAQLSVNAISVDTSNLIDSLFIDSCDPYVSWIGIAETPVEAVTSVHAGNQLLTSATTKHDWILDIYDRRPQNTGTVFDIYYVDQDNGQIYFRFSNGPYYNAIINGQWNVPVTVHHVWNAMDELALTFNMSRLYLESDESLRDRIKDVFSSITLSGTYLGIPLDGEYKKIGNATALGAGLAIARDLGLSSTNTTDLVVKVYGTYSKGFFDTYFDDFGRPLEGLSDISRMFSHVSRAFSRFAWGRVFADSSTSDYISKLTDD